MKKKIVREEDLIQALDAQKAKRIPLGQLAVKEKFLEAKQLFKILTAQRKRGDGAGNFGAVAIEMGFMTAEKMEELVKIQNATNDLLGDILVEQGFITRSELLQRLKEFRVLSG